MQRRFRVNSPPVVLETVDEQTIIVNLDTGSYYDLNHSGGRVLEALSAGADTDAATLALAEVYAIEADEIAELVAALIADLEREGIIEESSSDAAVNGNGNGGSPATRAYEPPALRKYTDMQELLLLDPIHEVDDTGWPNRV